MSKTSSSLAQVEGLTVKEVAYLLRVAPKTVYGWCYNEKVIYFKIAGNIRIRQEDLEALKDEF